jgi:hypothetical protein
MMRFNIRRCTHYREDNSAARAVEINVEIWRFCFCVVLAV